MKGIGFHSPPCRQRISVAIVARTAFVSAARAAAKARSSAVGICCRMAVRLGVGFMGESLSLKQGGDHKHHNPHRQGNGQIGAADSGQVAQGG